MKLLADQYVPIEFWPMMTTILSMILAPVLIGLLINRYFHRYSRTVMPWMPFVAMLAICIAVALTVALSRQELLATGLIVFGAAVCHNASGFALGYVGSRVLGLNVTDSRTIAIDVGMQNGGMATGLAFSVLESKAAAMVSAVEGPWGAIAGCGLASYWAGIDRNQTEPTSSIVPQNEAADPESGPLFQDISGA
jgi:bile acid:Na+ symporter, BASS family